MSAAPVPAPIPAGVLADAAAAARALLRTGEAEEAALLARLAATAIGLAEAFTGRQLIARACEDVIAGSTAWRPLAGFPVTAIQGVTVLPVDGAPFVLAADAYAIDIDGEGTGWVRLTAPGGPTRVAVAYQAGEAADWAAVAAPVAQGIAMLAAHLFDHREDDAAPPAAVAALWRPWRRMRLRTERRACLRPERRA